MPAQTRPTPPRAIIRHGSYYYLFVSIDYCCNQNVATDNYKEAVGRSTSPHGPFTDEAGTSMMNGGATVLLQSDAEWSGTGGVTAYIDPDTGESLLVFHALHLPENGAMYMWIKNLTWTNDWPSIAPWRADARFSVGGMPPCGRSSKDLTCSSLAADQQPWT